MLEELKLKIEDKRLVKEDAKYQDELKNRRDKYKQLLYYLGDEEAINGIPLSEMTPLVSTDEVIVIEEFVSRESVLRENVDRNSFIIFAARDGKLSLEAKNVIKREFDKTDIALVYANEDTVTPFGRINPIMKPEYSPDTLEAYLYVGNLVAVRMSCLCAVLEHMQFQDDPYMNYYNMLLRTFKILNRNQVIRVEKVLYSRYQRAGEDLSCLKGAFWGTDKKYDKIKKHILECNRDKLICKKMKAPLVSIVIPSKDQPQLMRECITSIFEKNLGFPFEVIVIDNGSVGENRLRIASLKDELGFSYYYEPGEFHFSKMCNSGAIKARGEYLLFLNDDTKMLSENSLELLVTQCSYEHVGAVGVKLLYKDEETIQHAGIINTQIGPVHIGIGKKDDCVLYGGYNVLNRNVLAVTGACMMIKAEKFHAVGGFDEAFRVTYNDVELCLKLYKAGYHNVIRNDVKVIHFESSSRGDDSENADRMERLIAERDLLFSKHPDMQDNDPYFSRFLDGTGKEISIRVPNLKRKYKLFGMKKSETPACQNEALMVQIDYAGLDTGLGARCQGYLIEGWWYVIDQNNARYEATLLLLNQETGCFYKCKFEPILREDVAQVFSSQLNVELSGFSVLFEQDKLAPGKYEIGMLVKDKCSRHQVFRMTGTCFALDK
ncbi:MAG: glycosyltransferase [Lachnospiraceae bacterium]|nr:glycosyltransferase [Lachnospiraceae bacterium]